MQVTFSVSDAWIDEAFQQMDSWSNSLGAEEISPGVAFQLLGLLMHGSLSGPEHFLRNVLELGRRVAMEGLLQRLVEVAEARTSPDLLRKISLLTGSGAKTRSHGIRITTVDAFSEGFLPPDASRAWKATCRLFERRHQRVGGRRSIGFALASYLVLLTIHPLVDGNGRTARALFAADCVANGLGAWPMLSLMLMQQDQNRLFHLAARCARQGDFGMLVSCYEQADRQARRYFGACLREMYAREGDDCRQHSLALELRERLELMLVGGAGAAI